MALVVLLAIGAALFAFAFFTKRRYGVLGLGLTAGLVLSQEVTKEVADFLRYVDFPVDPLPFTAAASLLLILLPALVLLLSGPRYSDQRYAMFGSILFAIYGVVLVLPSLVSNLPAADKAAVQPLLSAVAANTSMIVALGITTAVIDVMHSHGKSPLGKKSKH